MKKHFTHILNLTAEEGMALVKRAQEMKTTSFRSNLLQDKVIVLLFEKASTRTRLSFEMSVRHLGGSTVFMTPNDSQLGRSEPWCDTARVLSRYAQGVIIRTYGQENLDTLMEFGSIPVVNALTTEGHPCQVMSDMLTIYEYTPHFSEVEVAWVGDGNNMANSWIEAAMVFPISLRLACPKGYEPPQELLAKAKAAGAKILLTDNPREAVAGAHYINTDVWASMGQESEKIARQKAFAGYIVDDALMSLAHPTAKFMHCLPAHRGEEVSEAVLEGPASVVFEQVENRLHMQKAILERIFLHA